MITKAKVSWVCDLCYPDHRSAGVCLAELGRCELCVLQLEGYKLYINMLGELDYREQPKPLGV